MVRYVFTEQSPANPWPITKYKSCPSCGGTDLEYPTYLNKIDPSGLSQPRGPIGDDGLIHTGGIVRPADGRAAPSGLTRTVIPNEMYLPSGVLNHVAPSEEALARMQAGTVGGDYITKYEDINHYEPYWYCASCSGFFVYPSGIQATMVPASGYQFL